MLFISVLSELTEKHLKKCIFPFPSENKTTRKSLTCRKQHPGRVHLFTKLLVRSVHHLLAWKPRGITTLQCWNKHERMERMGNFCKVRTQNRVFQSQPISWKKKHLFGEFKSIYISIILSNEATAIPTKDRAKRSKFHQNSSHIKLDLTHSTSSSWWFQGSFKICSSNCIISPQFSGWKKHHHWILVVQ